MQDDRLDLPVLASHPDAVPGAVVVYSLPEDDNARLWVRLPVGDPRCLTGEPPEAAPSFAARLTSPGFHGPTVPRPLVHAEHTAGCMGASPKDVPMTTPATETEPAAPVKLAVQFRLDAAGVVGWGEAAVYASSANNLLRRVAAVDVKDVLAYPPGTHSVELPVLAPIAAGETLWLAIAVWVAPGSPGPMPRVLASAYPDPIASGGVLRLTGDAALVRPSQMPEAIGWDPFAPSLPIAAVLTIP